jgi:hypothetical protein
MKMITAQRKGMPQRIFLCLYLLCIIVLLGVLSFDQSAAAALTDSTPIAINTPARVAGYNGVGDERDVDLYPALAYDPATQRYLLVWLSLRNAGGRSDGFDLYGMFLSQTAQPLGVPFRISDGNSVARSSRPTVAAGNEGFVVIWTARGNPCRLYAQSVTDAAVRPDRLVNVGSTVHHHSPRLVYNATRQRFVLAFAAGDDYLPPTLFGAASADCGDNAVSTSQVRVAELFFIDDTPMIEFPLTVSEAQGGAFRPALAYSQALDQYMVIWEDRRSAAGEPYLFDIYAQRLDGDLTADGTNFALSIGGSYVNSDTTATWTPRPALAAGESSFLATWFERQPSHDAAVWSIHGRLIPGIGAARDKFSIAETILIQRTDRTAPSGFVDSAYHGPSQEFLVALTSHIESVFGYFSSTRIQRIDLTGQLLKADGQIQDTPGIGTAIDFANDDQLTLALATNPTASSNTGYLVAYGKHAPNQHAKDFDIWAGRILVTGSITPGDCNGDQSIGASDLTALALEFFDGDDNGNPADAANGTFAGSAACDANQDNQIGASDLTCIALIFFNGPGACTTVTSTASATPLLSIAGQIPASPGGQVSVPITLQGGGGEVSSLLFSIDFDETWLTFDPADANEDGIPDAVTFNLPDQYVRSVTFDPSDTDGELDVMLASFASPAVALADGAILTVTLSASDANTPVEATVGFSTQPTASFGDTKGRDIAGVTGGGSVLITAEPAAQPPTIYLPLIQQEGASNE